MNKTFLTCRTFSALAAALLMYIGPIQVVYAQQLVEFQEFEAIPTNGTRSWKYFTIGTDHFLAVANGYNGSTHNLDSKLYQWNGTNFVEFQSIHTSSAFYWEFFTIGTDHFLAVANYYNGSSYNIDSKIYWWNGASFVEFQAIPAIGAIDL